MLDGKKEGLAASPIKNSLHQSAELEEVFWGVGRSRISRLDSSRARITCQDEIADAISFFCVGWA